MESLKKYKQIHSPLISLNVHKWTCHPGGLLRFLLFAFFANKIVPPDDYQSHPSHESISEVTNCASQRVLVTRLECHRGTKWENFAPDDALGAKITAAFTAQTSNWQLNTRSRREHVLCNKAMHQSDAVRGVIKLTRRQNFSACHILTCVCARAGRKYDRKKCGFNKKFLSLRPLFY